MWTTFDFAGADGLHFVEPPQRGVTGSGEIITDENF